jgi:hypothetical protein
VVRDDEVSVRVDADAGGSVELCVDGRSVVSCIARGTVPGDRGDDADGVDHANAVVGDDVDVVAVIDDDACHVALKPRAGGGTAVAGVAGGSGAGDRGNVAGGVNPDNAIAPGVADVEVTGGIVCHPGRIAEVPIHIESLAVWSHDFVVACRGLIDRAIVADGNSELSVRFAQAFHEAVRSISRVSWLPLSMT